MSSRLIASSGVAVLVGAAMVGATGTASPVAAADQHDTRHTRHVLLLSVDGLHQSDLTWYTARHPRSALAALVHRGVEFTHAQTPFPSDSFPGLLGQVTGGTPASTGVFYDVGFDRSLVPAGTTRCAGATAGAEVAYAENLDRNQQALDAGQGLPGLPDGILAMTPDPRTLIDPARLPVDPVTCRPVYPHRYLKVNTVFEVARRHGLRTAWSDKHPAYEVLDGPSGRGVEDLFTPEVNSQAAGLPAGQDWTKDNVKTRRYDAYKAHAVVNEVNGLDHSGHTHVGTPAVFGMNFQAVSTGEKLPAGGYEPGGVIPRPVLAGALDFVDAETGRMLRAITERGLADSTTVILSAKHGQSPTDPRDLTRIDDGPLLAGLNAEWKAAHPGTGDLVSHATDDDGMLLWLTDRSAVPFARRYLLAQSGHGTDVAGAPKAYEHAGLAAVLAGPTVFGVAPRDPRVPDLVGIVQHGVVYTGGKGKIAEHGGADPQDRHVPLVVAGPDVPGGVVNGDVVATTQIAPTILRLLGLDPEELQAVRQEHTRSLIGG
jgi:hypothetical protein